MQVSSQKQTGDTAAQVGGEKIEEQTGRTGETTDQVECFVHWRVMADCYSLSFLPLCLSLSLSLSSLSPSSSSSTVCFSLSLSLSLSLLPFSHSPLLFSPLPFSSSSPPLLLFLSSSPPLPLLSFLSHSYTHYNRKPVSIVEVLGLALKFVSDQENSEEGEGGEAREKRPRHSLHPLPRFVSSQEREILGACLGRWMGELQQDMAGEMEGGERREKEGGR